MSKLAEGKIICITEDYLINEFDVTINTEGFITVLKGIPITVPFNPVMLCRGIATSWSGDSSTLFILER
jgi:hypothetical protein